MSKYDGLKLENQLCFPLYAASREVIKKYRPYLDALDLTYTQYITMMVFWEEKKISVKELGKKLYLDSGTLTPVLKSLEAKGFVKRYRSTEDERDKAVSVPAEVSKCIRLEQGEAIKLYELLYKVLRGVTEG